MNFLGGDVLQWAYSLALLVLGFALVLLEIFVIPGFNIFGVVGFLTDKPLDQVKMLGGVIDA